jgi:hypothetical protein
MILLSCSRHPWAAPAALSFPHYPRNRRNRLDRGNRRYPLCSRFPCDALSARAFLALPSLLALSLRCSRCSHCPRNRRDRRFPR